MNNIRTFEGSYIREYPTAAVDTDGTVSLKVPHQWYDLADLKGLIKFLKGVKNELKELQGAQA